MQPVSDIQLVQAFADLERSLHVMKYLFIILFSLTLAVSALLYYQLRKENERLWLFIGKKFGDIDKNSLTQK